MAIRVPQSSYARFRLVPGRVFRSARPPNVRKSVDAESSSWGAHSRPAVVSSSSTLRRLGVDQTLPITWSPRSVTTVFSCHLSGVSRGFRSPPFYSYTYDGFFAWFLNPSVVKFSSPKFPKFLSRKKIRLYYLSWCRPKVTGSSLPASLSFTLVCDFWSPATKWRPFILHTGRRLFVVCTGRQLVVVSILQANGISPSVTAGDFPSSASVVVTLPRLFQLPASHRLFLCATLHQLTTLRVQTTPCKQTSLPTTLPHTDPSKYFLLFSGWTILLSTVSRRKMNLFYYPFRNNCYMWKKVISWVISNKAFNWRQL